MKSLSHIFVGMFMGSHNQPDFSLLTSLNLTHIAKFELSVEQVISMIGVSAAWPPTYQQYYWFDH